MADQRRAVSVASKNAALVATSAAIVAALALAGLAGAARVGKRDTTPPSAPTTLRVTATTLSSVSLAWTSSTDDVRVAGYGLYLGTKRVATGGEERVVTGGGKRVATGGEKRVVTVGGKRVATVGGTTGTWSRLACGTSYTLGVDAFDAAGNRSKKATLRVSTSACADTNPPSAVSGLVASNVSETALTLTWSASRDNVGVTGYEILRDGAKVAGVSSTSSNQSGLACGTAYDFAVVATDAAGNTSAPTSIAVSTSACSTSTIAASPTGTLFGVHQDLVYFGGDPYWSDRMNVASGLGARVSRSSLLWDKVEPSPGVFDWSRADAVVSGLVSRGIQPLMVLVGSPSWANGSSDRFVVPQDPTSYAKWVSDFASFARAAVARYSDRVHYWEIWNEENEKYFWKPEPRSAQQYTQLYNATRAAMLSADPSAKIAVGGLAGLWYSCCTSGREFLGQMVAAGAKIEHVAIHPYDGGAPDNDKPFDSNFTDIARIHDYLSVLGLPNAKLWVTEWGWKDQPTYLQKSLEMMRDDYPYVELATYFLDIDTPDYPGYGLYSTALQPKAAAAVFKSFVASDDG